MVNLLPRNVRITPSYREEPIDIGDVASINYNSEVVEQEEVEKNPVVYKGHWFWSALYPFICFLLVLVKIVSGASFFHWPLFESMPFLEMSSQRFGIALMAWSLNFFFFLPYLADRNQTHEDRDPRISSVFIVGVIVDICGTVVLAIYSHDFNSPNQLYDSCLSFLPADKTNRTLFIAMGILFDFAIALIYGKCDIITYNVGLDNRQEKVRFQPKKYNSRYKLGSFTGYIRDNIYSKNRLDIIHSSCYRIVIRNKGTTPVKFGDSSCADPTFRSVTSFKVERIVTRVKRFLCIFPYKSRERIDFTVRLMKTIPPGEDIIFVPEPHQVKGSYRIKGLRSFCVDRGDEVETRITLPYDRFPFLTRVEQYTRTTARRRHKYEETSNTQLTIAREQNSTNSTK